MSVTVGDIKELLGEHEGIRAHMRFLVRSREKLAAPDVRARERIWSYRCGLYDFRDAIQYHLEVDERIFRALPVNVNLQDPTQEHEEIQSVINDLIKLAESAAIEKLEQEELTQYAEKIGEAFNKTHTLIEAHIIKENAILEEALKNT